MQDVKGLVQLLGRQPPILVRVQVSKLVLRLLAVVLLAPHMVVRLQGEGGSMEFTFAFTLPAGSRGSLGSVPPRQNGQLAVWGRLGAVCYSTARQVLLGSVVV